MRLFKVLTSIVKKILLKSFPNYLVNRFIKQSEKGTTYIYGGYETRSHIKENCKYFLTKEQLADEKFVKGLVHDIIKCYLLYGTNANEYFCYKFPMLSDKERDTYLPRKRKDDLLIKNMGKDWSIHFDQLKDKYKFYQLTKDFFGRGACQVSIDSDYDDFNIFITKHQRVIAKPSRGGCGVGVTIIDLKDFANNSRKAFDYLMSFKTPFIVEEIVKQDSRMAEWNDSSINTLRIPSFRSKGGVRIVYPSVRIGRAGSIVDNAGSGGTFAAIDPLSGKIITDGFDKRGKSYEKHPDTNKCYKNSQIPDWNELVKKVEKLHQSLPISHRYVAFDFALSTQGWVLIEGNWGEMSMPQIEFGKGLYKEFENLLHDDN